MSLQTEISKQIPVQEVKSELDALIQGILAPSSRNKVDEFTEDWRNFTSRLGNGILRKIS